MFQPNMQTIEQDIKTFLTEYCYVCLRTNINLIHLNNIDKDDITFLEKLKPFTSDADLEEGLPDSLCEYCCTNLKISYKFLQMCIKSSDVILAYKGKLNTINSMPTNRDMLLKLLKIDTKNCCRDVADSVSYDENCNVRCETFFEVAEPKSLTFQKTVIIESNELIRASDTVDANKADKMNDCKEKILNIVEDDSPIVVKDDSPITAEDDGNIMDDDDPNVMENDNLNIVEEEDSNLTEDDDEYIVEAGDPNVIEDGDPYVTEGGDPNVLEDKDPNITENVVPHVTGCSKQILGDLTYSMDVQSEIIVDSESLLDISDNAKEEEIGEISEECHFQKDTAMNSNNLNEIPEESDYPNELVGNKEILTSKRTILMRDALDGNIEELEEQLTAVSTILRMKDDMIDRGKSTSPLPILPTSPTPSELPPPSSQKKTSSQEPMLRKYKCHLCDKSYVQKHSWKHHIRMHEGDKPHQCPKCNKSFVYKGLLRDHLNTHTGQRPYQCYICGKTYKMRSALGVHMNTHTGRKFKCEICGKELGKNSVLKEHMERHKETKNVECEICGHKFWNRGPLKDHMKLHSGEKNFECTLCEKKFALKQYLKKHMLHHTGAKPYKCTMCPKSFTDYQRLKKHFSLHTGLRSHECEICKKRFYLVSELKLHMLRHSETKPFKCDICEKGFITSNELRMHHKKKHTEQQDFKCNLCEAGFAYQYLLRMHYKQKHKMVGSVTKIEPVAKENLSTMDSDSLPALNADTIKDVNCEVIIKIDPMGRRKTLRSHSKSEAN